MLQLVNLAFLLELCSNLVGLGVYFIVSEEKPDIYSNAGMYLSPAFKLYMVHVWELSNALMDF